MKLSRLTLKDFRGFGEAEFDLMDPEIDEPLNLALLVGDNGSGKSSALHAIAGAFEAIYSTPAPTHAGAPTSRERLFRAEPLVLDDVRRGADEANIQLAWRGRLPSVASAAHLINWRGALLRTEPADLLARSRWYQRLSTGGILLESSDWASAWVGGVAQNSTGELITAYDVYRLLPNAPVEGPSLRRVLKHPCESSLAPTLKRSGEMDTRFAQLKQWIVNLDFLRTKAKLDRGEDLPTWSLLQQALDQILAPNCFAGVDEDFNVNFQTPHGLVPIQALSDGFRSIFVIVADLLMRMNLLSAKRDEALLQEAVCLIDEIDAHLHPRFQERVIPALRTLFPNVQFIATTHSPIIVASVEAKHVFQLSAEGA